MITLAGHGKDPRLVQAELPIVPNVGDRVRENLNTPNTNLKSLIREGIFLKTWERKGYKTQWMVSLDSSAVVPFDPDLSQIIERAAASVLVEESQIPLERQLKVGDRVYQSNPDSIGTITKISRGKAVVSVSDRTVIVRLDRLNLCDANYSPKPSKSVEEIQAEEEAAIAKAREEYLKSQSEEISKPKAKRKTSLPKGIKVGDMVTYLEDGTIGKVTSLSDRCINIETVDGIQSHSLELGAPKLEIHTHPNESVVFAIGDRVTLVSKTCDFGKFGMSATVTEKRWDKKIKCTRMSVRFDDGSIETNHIQGSGWFKKLQEDECSLTSIGLEVSEPSATPPDSPARSKQSDTVTSAKTRKRSITQTSLKSQSLETLEKRSHQQESISIQVDSPAQEPQTQEPKQDLNIQSLLSGLNISELSTKEDPDSLSSKTQLQLLITHCEQYLEDSEWLDISGTIRKSYKQLSLEVPKNAKGSLSLPTLTTNKGVKSRSSGQSKCEKWFRDKGLLEDTQCLSPQMMAVLFGFPMEWTKCLWDAQEDRTGASDLDTCLVEASTLTAVQQSLSESCTSIAVLVGAIVKPKFNGGKGKVISSTKKKISVSWFGANNVVTYTIAQFHNQIDILSVPSPSIDGANLDNSDHAIATKPSKSVAISRMDEVLVGSLDDRLAQLHKERDRLIQSGASPKGIWLEKSKPAKKDFIQVVWKSENPREEWGGKKSRYIGKADSDEHLSAIAQYLAGKKLQEIEREIKELSK